LIGRAAFATLLALGHGWAQAQEGPMPWVAATPAGHFLAAKDLDLGALLPPPPPRGSLAELADLEALRQAQAWRNGASEAWAKDIDQDSIWKHAPVLGPWFRAERLPKTARFFWKLTVDVHAISEEAKLLYGRPRPPKLDPDLRPCVPLPPNDSYPSGHSMQAFVRAGVLAEIFPEHRDALMARAHRAAWARILGGVHFPTDDVAGRLLAEAIVKRLKGQPGFRAEVIACRAEMRNASRD
jgi:acid phosphatase (class A)